MLRDASAMQLIGLPRNIMTAGWIHHHKGGIFITGGGFILTGGGFILTGVESLSQSGGCVTRLRG
jgi:hypothetical protein